VTADQCRGATPDFCDESCSCVCDETEGQARCLTQFPFTQFNGETCQCECPSVAPITCPPLQKWDREICTCACPKVEACPLNYTFDPFSCRCASGTGPSQCPFFGQQCEGGAKWNDQTCACSCDISPTCQGQAKFNPDPDTCACECGVASPACPTDTFSFNDSPDVCDC
jgi:hypothetical protein